MENGVLTDLKIERKTSPTLVGSIHRGRVIRVLPGMQAAFVDIGLDRAAFLYVGDVRGDMDGDSGDYFEQESTQDSQDVLDEVAEAGPPPEPPKPRIQELLNEGQS